MTLRELKDIAASARAQVALDAKLEQEAARKLKKQRDEDKARAIINILPERLLVAARRGETDYYITEATWQFGTLEAFYLAPPDAVANLVWQYCQKQAWNPQMSKTYVSLGYEVEQVWAIRIALL